MLKQRYVKTSVTNCRSSLLRYLWIIFIFWSLIYHFVATICNTTSQFPDDTNLKCYICVPIVFNYHQVPVKMSLSYFQSVFIIKILLLLSLLSVICIYKWLTKTLLYITIISKFTTRYSNCKMSAFLWENIKRRSIQFITEVPRLQSRMNMNSKSDRL